MNKAKARQRKLEQKKILNFIERRFGDTDAYWNDGNCYYFALILHARFNKCGEIVYDPIVGHFKYLYDGHCYDYNGINDDNIGSLLPFESLRTYDRSWWEHLMRDCIM